MRLKRRGIKLLALFLGLSLVAAACGSDDNNADKKDDGTKTSEPAKSGGELIDLQNFATGEPDHIDPGLAGVLQGAQIGQLVYDGLLDWDFTDREDPELKPQVADLPETNDDGKTWVFTIRDDQQFSNGDPVLASSFKKAWDLAASAEYASEISYHFLPIEGAEAVTAGDADEISGVVADDDAGTLTVTLTDVFSDFPAVVTHPVFSPKPDEAMAAGADYEQGVMIGNGPFKMSEPWQHETQIKLEANENWNGGIYGEDTKANLESIVFKISKDVDSAYADFEAGNGQTASIPSGRFDEATGKYGHATDAVLGLYQFFVNQESQLGGPDNLKLRQAIAKAINREDINDAVYDGTRRLPTGMTPPGVPGYTEGLCGDLCEYDLDGAKALIDEWKTDGGALDHPIVVNFNAGSGHEDVVAIIQQNLQAIGLDSKLDGRDATTYFTDMRKGDCELCRSGWIWDYPSYDNAAFALLDSKSIGGDNLARYNNADVDKDIAEARATIDADARAKLYQAAEKQALEDVAMIPINWYAGQLVFSDDVEGLAVTPLFFVTYELASLK